MSESAVLYGFLGTVATLISGIVIVILNQRAAFKKVEQDAAIKAAALAKIHTLVDGRLKKALTKIASLEAIVAELRGHQEKKP